MRICIDVRCLMDARRTGVEEYTLNLLLNLFKIDQKNQYVLFLNSWKKPSFDFSIFKKYQNVEVKRFKIPNKLLNLSFWYLGWPKIDNMVGGADIVFMPNIVFGSVSKKTKLVLTMHDLSFERYSKYFSWKRKFWHIFINPKRLCQCADRIIAVSYSTKNDLVSLYKINRSKIEMVHSSVSYEFEVINRNDANLIKAKEKYKLPYRFILYFGTIEPRKNICAAIKAFDEFHKFAYISKNDELLKYKLVIAGEKGWLSQKIFKEMGLARGSKSIFFIGRIPRSDKKYIYNLSSLFIYPSFFEGFGFPPLEAMKCGVPVIASNNSSLPEIIGNNGILIDPDKPSEIYQAIREILVNKNLKESFIKKGLQKSAEFDWKKSALKYLGIMKKMV